MKRARENAEREHSKWQRTASPEKPLSVAVPTTKIVDLNDDCLKKIFGYLNLQSLFNVAIANKWLRPAARAVHSRKYAAKPIRIHGCDENITRIKDPGLKEIDARINVLGLKATLQYLRCFGPSITELTICYNQSRSKSYEYVHEYLNEYCSDRLNCILFSEMPNIATEQLKKVFKNVHEISMWDSHLGEQFSSFVDCFPNVRCLQLHRVAIECSTEKPFRRLDDLCIRSCNVLKSKAKIVDLLRVSDRLSSLEINMNDEHVVSIDTLLGMIVDNPMLTKLMVLAYFHWKRPSHMDAGDLRRLAREHPALVELELQCFQFTVDNAIALIQQLKALRMFRFMVTQSEYTKLNSELNNSDWQIEQTTNYRMTDVINYHDVTMKRKAQTKSTKNK